MRPARVLLLAVGTGLCAVDLERVRTVEEAPAPTRLPEAGRSVLGVLNVRGEVVPLLDTAVALGLPDGGAPAYASVVDTARGPLALATPDVPRTAPLGEDLGPADLPAAHGRRRCGGEVAVLLDPDALAARVREGA